MKWMEVREWMGGSGAKERKAAMGVKKPCPCPSEHKTLSGQELSHTHTHTTASIFLPVWSASRWRRTPTFLTPASLPKRTLDTFFFSSPSSTPCSSLPLLSSPTYLLPPTGSISRSLPLHGKSRFDRWARCSLRRISRASPSCAGPSSCQSFGGVKEAWPWQRKISRTWSIQLEFFK